LPRPKKSRGYATISETTTPSSSRSNISKSVLNSSSINNNSSSGSSIHNSIVNSHGDSTNALDVAADASEDGESSTDKVILFQWFGSYFLSLVNCILVTQ